jgi:hypothetical protein
VHGLPAAPFQVSDLARGGVRGWLRIWARVLLLVWARVTRVLLRVLLLVWARVTRVLLLI